MGGGGPRGGGGWGCGGDPPPPYQSAGAGDTELLEVPKAPKKLFGLN